MPVNMIQHMFLSNTYYVSPPFPKEGQGWFV